MTLPAHDVAYLLERAAAKVALASAEGPTVGAWHLVDAAEAFIAAGAIDKAAALVELAAAVPAAAERIAAMLPAASDTPTPEKRSKR
jgi:hypothetical protein